MSKRVVAAIVLFFISHTVYCVARWDVIRLDGFQGEIFMVIAPPETSYADDYTHEKFAKIKLGMSEQEVLGIVGEPQLRWAPYLYTMYQHKAHYVGLQYSSSPTSTNYRLRQIYLDNGKVAEIIAYYYLD